MQSQALANYQRTHTHTHTHTHTDALRAREEAKEEGGMETEENPGILVQSVAVVRATGRKALLTWLKSDTVLMLWPASLYPSFRLSAEGLSRPWISRRVHGAQRGLYPRLALPLYSDMP